MTCRDCEYLGDPCPRHTCPCEVDIEGVTVSPDCDEHAHLIEEEEVAS